MDPAVRNATITSFGPPSCGVITYTASGAQKVAVATGLTEILWPTEITTAKVSILGLDIGK
jgi:hypothetical protein